MFDKWVKFIYLYKDVRNSIHDEDRLIIESTPEMVYSVNVLISVDRRVAIEDISEQMDILWIQHTKLCMIPFLRSVVGGFHQDNARQEQWKPAVSLVGNSCNILLTIHVFSSLLFLIWLRQRISARTKFSCDNEVKSTESKW